MKYKGYEGKIELDPDAHIFHGEVIDTRDVITFQGTSVEELERAFRDSVDDYLQLCKSRGEAPDKAFSGKFLVRIPSALHRQIAIAASLRDESVNKYVARVLREDAKEKTARRAAD